MILPEQWQNFIKSVDSFLADLLSSLSHCPPSLKEVLSYSTFGAGKRFRPLLVFSAADLFSLPQASSLRIAAAVELVHAYSLIHDDLPAMDNAHWRRGKPSCHLAFSEALAILAGDSLLPLAFEILAQVETHVCAEKRLTLSRLLAQAIGCEGMVAGQVYDMEAGASAELSISQLTLLQSLKTGALMRFCLLTPACLMDRPDPEKEALRLYSTHLALVFQIADDLLDLKHFEKTGKDHRKDIQTNKKTWVTLLGEPGAREVLTHHHQSALEALKPWGDNASFLREMLYFAAHRQQ